MANDVLAQALLAQYARPRTDTRGALAARLMQQAADTSPVATPMAGLARALTGGFAGYMSQQAEADAQAREGAMFDRLRQFQDEQTARQRAEVEGASGGGAMPASLPGMGGGMPQAAPVERQSLPALPQGGRPAAMPGTPEGMPALSSPTMTLPPPGQGAPPAAQPVAAPAPAGPVGIPPEVARLYREMQALSQFPNNPQAVARIAQLRNQAAVLMEGARDQRELQQKLEAEARQRAHAEEMQRQQQAHAAELQRQAQAAQAQRDEETARRTAENDRNKPVRVADGEQTANAPEAARSAEQTLAQIDGVLNHPALRSATGIISFTGALPGTPMRDFASRVEQLQGRAFLQAFESLKGGGAITQVEGEKATQAIARLNRNLAPADFRAAVQELRDIVETGRQRAAARLPRNAEITGQATVPGPNGGAAVPPPRPGEVQDGFRFRGGNPADPNSWERVR